MRKYKEIESIESVCESITCDVCDIEFGEKEDFEIQEFHFIDFFGGYASVFGDESHVQVDICQHCFKGMLEKSGIDINEHIE